MKKLIIILSFILIFNLSGCSNIMSEYLGPQEKEASNLYGSKLNDLFVDSKNFTIKIFDMDYYTYYSVKEEDFIVVKDFMSFLKEEDFSLDDKSTFDNTRPKFKLIVEFEEEKYVFNIYNEEFTTLYPWDGVYDEDLINMSNIPDYYNLYKFCNYVIKVTKGFEG